MHNNHSGTIVEICKKYLLTGELEILDGDGLQLTAAAHRLARLVMFAVVMKREFGSHRAADPLAWRMDRGHASNFESMVCVSMEWAMLLLNDRDGKFFRKLLRTDVEEHAAYILMQGVFEDICDDPGECDSCPIELVWLKDVLVDKCLARSVDDSVTWDFQCSALPMGDPRDLGSQVDSFSLQFEFVSHTDEWQQDLKDIAAAIEKTTTPEGFSATVRPDAGNKTVQLDVAGHSEADPDELAALLWERWRGQLLS